MTTSTIVILLILAIIVVFALRSSVKHMKGQGGCCGGSDTSKPKKKKLDSPVVATKVITIDGMHCENCKNRIEKAVNSLDGALCKVNLNKNIATISMSKTIDDNVLKSTIENLDFKVTSITLVR